MTKSGKLIKFFSAPVPHRRFTPFSVKITKPAPGPVAPTFDASGTLTAPDTILQSCVCGATAASSISTTGTKWGAHFMNVPVNPNPVKLTAKGNMGGLDFVMVTVAAVGGSKSIELKPATAPNGARRRQTASAADAFLIQTLRVRRRNPGTPNGFALSLEFRGVPQASFGVDIRLPDPEDKVSQCLLGKQSPDSLFNRKKAWLASFSQVPPGSYVLQVRTAKGREDQVRIEVKVAS
jgi:hypothetical protein